MALVAIPLTIGLAGHEQINRSAAGSGTTLTFDPASTQETPINLDIDNELTLGLRIEPGDDNVISFVKFVIEYDAEVFDVAPEDFQLNEEAFPELLEGPTVADGKIIGSVAVGSDPANAITEPQSIGSLTLYPVKSTGGAPTTVAYSAESEVLSLGEDVDKNVLSTTGAAIILVGQGSEPPEEEPEDEELAGDTPAEIPDNVTTVVFTALLHGIGSAGDSVNPNNNSLSNKTPVYELRPATVAVLDENGEDIARAEGDLVYDENTGKFAAQISFDEKVPEGTYTAMVFSEQYLPVEKEITITAEKSVNLGELSLITGDIIPDGTLDILDYNVLTDCGYGSGTPLPMEDPGSLFQSEACQKHEFPDLADLDDNGTVDSSDFNLFLRELSKQGAPATPLPTTVPATPSATLD